ncbi:hypothetical protein [Hydrogenophaga sp.]|uniref:hypothetical protein n=1 Tax=Hydrogenophaga sp. TaxID=1904254 RepID=UPI002FC6D40A
MTLLNTFVAKSLPFPWRKRGRIFEPGGDDFSHGSHPCAIHIVGDRYVVAFTRRDERQRSHIFLSNAIVSDGQVELQGKPKAALWPGEPCHFDCDGAISVCFVKHRGAIYLYYVGWQNLPEGLWICDTGRAKLDEGELTLTREFAGPVLGRDKNNPLFAAATAFHVSGDLWQTWYNSGLRWEKTAQGWKHHYGIHYAHSNNGVDWVCHPGMCLPFKDEYEYAFGRPSVIHREGTYFMWYAHRATRTTDTYRIGFASSVDGRHWERHDELSGIDVAPTGWDSEMICYPCVFEHRGQMYMLYNGNGYGKTGFGLAVMEETP